MKLGDNTTNMQTAVVMEILVLDHELQQLRKDLEALRFTEYCGPSLTALDLRVSLLRIRECALTARLCAAYTVLQDDIHAGNVRLS